MGQARARSDAEFEAKMQKLEQVGEDLNRIKASIVAGKEARQCNRNSSARAICNLTVIYLTDFSSGFATVDSRFQAATQNGRTFGQHIRESGDRR